MALYSLCDPRLTPSVPCDVHAGQVTLSRAGACHAVLSRSQLPLVFLSRLSNWVLYLGSSNRLSSRWGLLYCPRTWAKENSGLICLELLLRGFSSEVTEYEHPVPTESWSVTDQETSFSQPTPHTCKRQTPPRSFSSPYFWVWSANCTLRLSVFPFSWLNNVLF